MFYPMLLPRNIFSTIQQLKFRRKHGRGDRMATAQGLHEDQLTDGISVCTLCVTHCNREATLSLLLALLHYFSLGTLSPALFKLGFLKQTYHLFREIPGFAQESLWYEEFQCFEDADWQMWRQIHDFQYLWTDFTQKTHRDMRQLTAFLAK